MTRAILAIASACGLAMVHGVFAAHALSPDGTVTARYLKTNRYTQRGGRSSARVEIDVMAAGIGAERSATFRIHFEKMKDGTSKFRKHINFGG